VLCGIGGAGAISSALMALCTAGDEVLLPDPTWPNYHLLLAV